MTEKLTPTHVNDIEAYLGGPVNSLLPALEEHRSIEWWLTQVDSDHPNADAKIEDAIVQVDGLLAAFGIDTTNSAQTFIRGYTRRGDDFTEFIPDDALTVGSVLFNLAYFDFDIEGDEAGVASAHLSFCSPYGFVLELSSEGDFWTEREYIDPRTGVAKWGADIADDQALALSSNPEIEVRSEISYTLRFECVIEIAEWAK